MSATGDNRVCVVVLGELARSPRMCYHAQSLAQSGRNVLLVGYVDPSRPVSLPASVQVVAIRGPPAWFRALPGPLCLALRLLWQAVTLIWTLLTCVRFVTLLVQTPPGVPALFVAWLACRLRRARFIVDWHNYSGAILALSLGGASVLVRLVSWLEFASGSRANAAFCVTHAMRHDLEQRRLSGGAGSRIVTLHDRPAARFCSVSLQHRHALMVELSGPGALLEPLLQWVDADLNTGYSNTMTAFTRVCGDTISLRADRPGLLVSSTSWTEDEDFAVLLRALAAYEAAREASPGDFPPLVCVITGRGPLRDFYLELVRGMRWRHVCVLTGWLQERQYAGLLGCADLGVSLHVSASGLDLPMKVVDMFGAGLPVCAHHFACISELVEHGENGLVFENDEQLAEQLLGWFRGFPDDKQLCRTRERFQVNIERFRKRGWHENWTDLALPLF